MLDGDWFHKYNLYTMATKNTHIVLSQHELMEMKARAGLVDACNSSLIQPMIHHIKKLNYIKWARKELLAGLITTGILKNEKKNKGSKNSKKNNFNEGKWMKKRKPSSRFSRKINLKRLIIKYSKMMKELELSTANYFYQTPFKAVRNKFKWKNICKKFRKKDNSIIMNKHW